MLIKTITFFLFLCFFTQLSTAQTETVPTTPPAISNSPTLPLDSQPDAIAQHQADLSMLRWWSYGIIIIASVVGLAVFHYRHARILRHDWWAGLLVTFFLAVLLQFFSMNWLLSDDASACLQNDLNSNANPVEYIESCRLARETVADSLLLKTAFSLITKIPEVNARPLPIRRNIINAMIYLTTLIGSVLLYLLTWKIIRISIYKNN